MTTVQPTVSSQVGDDSTDISGRDSGAGARDKQTSLPTTYVEHMQHIVESFDRWNDASRLLDASGRV